MSTALVQPSRYDQREIVDTIKQTVAKGASEAQLRMFLEVCKRTGLDPFLKEIWYVPEKGIIMAGRDGYLRVANEHPAFDGMKTRVERDDKGIPIKATCTVWRKDRGHPIICEAWYSEYKKSSPVWNQYPSAMISKVAEVLALKRSFAINGVVTEEEIGNEPAGSKEAAQQVAERRITELKQSVPAAAKAEVASSPLDLILNSFSRRPEDKSMQDSLQRIIVAFAEMRERMEPIAKGMYDRIMLGHNVTAPKDFKNPGQAKACYTDMWAELRAAQSAQPKDFQATDDDLPAGMFSPERPI